MDLCKGDLSYTFIQVFRLMRHISLLFKFNLNSISPLCQDFGAAFTGGQFCVVSLVTDAAPYMRIHFIILFLTPVILCLGLMTRVSYCLQVDTDIVILPENIFMSGILNLVFSDFAQPADRSGLEHSEPQQREQRQH